MLTKVVKLVKNTISCLFHLPNGLGKVNMKSSVLLGAVHLLRIARVGSDLRKWRSEISIAQEFRSGGAMGYLKCLSLKYYGQKQNIHKTRGKPFFLLLE